MTEDVEPKTETAVETPPAKKPVIILNRDDEDMGLEDPATQEMLVMIEESLKTLDEGEIVRGKVLRLDDTEVLVDIGGKSEGVISMGEFSDADAIKVGDIIDVFL
ncbi:MAG TPA: S1 RNA-binding domain-containing protein, partial [Dongiaceae bacterium]|nr:S1 RNA-binding domain-containing protein [Dongiaceae bacterium]